MKLRKGWTTHIPVLIKAVQQTSGPVLELGSGIFSTPLLHWLCEGRKLVTYEGNKKYIDFSSQFRSRNHRIVLIDDWDKIDTQTQWSVVLVDHVSERRAIDAIRLKDNVEYLILHDTDDADFYGYETIWPHFKERFDWKLCKHWTSVLSNKKSLDIFK